MFDRRLVTDIGLALLIALPSALPAAPSPWNASDEPAKPVTGAAQAAAEIRSQVNFAEISHGSLGG